ncbi:T-cell differentiation antigen CD6-like isoform X1 [Conger conger]|uniref:T-cell differentiation antigen CD6-like isoform X1 n=1 Tax=Conger conger TaxID=82655 RepID=UPI002A5A7F53|nr:T-cell differentiation antigen CD6-like isoform X1 [Conger conger]XP_061119170.1 T-cell differentiation antigen CD6-like isoform X1 [Conger conger]XP_061119179.1 T-cell differentiation antigen CD6-like isoform X1 [Conger conger]
MELLKVAIVLQALSLCQGLQIIISPSQKNVSQSEGTDEPAINEIDAFTPQLSGNCSGTLGVFNHTEWTAVLLTPQSVRKVADKICRHLGCRKAFSVSHTALHNATCLTNCTYSDSKLMNCTEVSQSSCTNVTEIVCKSSLNKTVRLVGGSNRCEGRVELWNAGKWGTVCNDSWDLEDASVVCRQLNCGSAFRVTGEGGGFGVGSGPIFLDKVNCTGTEKNLWNCSALRNSSCTHREDAGVVCSESPGAQHTSTVAVTTGVWSTTLRTTVPPSQGPRLAPAEVGCIILSVLLVMALAVNAIFCWRFRKRERGVSGAVEQSKHSLHSSTGQQENDYRSADDAHKLPTDTTRNDVLLNPRALCAQQSLGNYSIDSDYEPYDFSVEPSVALATFKNSLRNRGDDRSPTLKPSSLYCLTEEGTDHTSGPADNAGLPGCHEQAGGPPTLGENHMSGVNDTKNHAIPTADSFDSFPSSEECYENTREAELHTQGDALPVEMAERGEAFQPQRAKCGPELDDSFDSSSTSSGECYENTGEEAERHVQEMTGKEPLIQPQNKHYNPGLTNFQPDRHSQVDSFDSSSTSSGEFYENIEREAELHIQGEGTPTELAEREDPIQPQTEDQDPGFTSCHFQPSPQNDGDSSSTSSGDDDDDYDIPEGQAEPLCPAVREDFDQSSSDSDYDDVANYIL